MRQGDEVSVKVEAVAILADAVDPAVGVRHHVHQENDVVQYVSYFRFVAVGQGPYQFDGCIHTRILIAVDAGVNVEGHLEVLETFHHGLSPNWVLDHELP